MPNYKIKITPLEYFFFGGEKHNEELKTNYFVESQNYPQQTTILGMLRYLLLQEKNLLGGRSLPKAKQEKAKELIGEESFKYSKGNDFGKIKSISPLYFTKKDKNYFFAPMDIKFDLIDEFQLKCSSDKKLYNSKDHYNLITQYLISEDFKDIVKLSEIIKDIEVVGNEKGEKGKTKENTYYKQNMKRIEKGWSFVVDAQIDLKLDDKDYVIPFGGEKCLFQISISDSDAFSATYPEKHYRNNKFCILCLSDCFLEGKAVKELDFAVNDYVSFRNFRSKINTSNFYALKKEKDINESVIRSSRYQLLKRGSVLYFNCKNERDTMATKIEKDSSTTIGFNKILKNN